MRNIQGVMQRAFVLLMLLASTFSLTEAVAQNGTSPADAIEYSLNGQLQDLEAGKLVWYHINLAPVWMLDEPMLNLVLSNSTSVSNTVHLTAYLGGVENTQNKGISQDIVISANGKRVWTKDLSPYRSAVTEMYLSIQSTTDSKMAADVMEREDVVSMCDDSREFVAAGTDIEAGSTAWYALDLSSVKSAANQVLVLEYRNTGSVSAMMKASRTPQCPTTAVKELNTVLAPGAVVRDTIARALLESMTNEMLYVQVSADAPIRVRALQETAIFKMSWTNVQNPRTVVPSDENWYSLTATTNAKLGWFRVLRSDLIEARHQPQIVFDNRGNATAATAEVEILFSKNDKETVGQTDYLHYTVSMGAGEVGHLDFAMNMVQELSEDIKYVYARVHVSQPMPVQLRLRHIREQEGARYAIPFDWTNGHVQTLSRQLWYAVDIRGAKQNASNIEIQFVNRGSAAAQVSAVVAMSINYADPLEFQRTVAAGGTVSKVLEYSLISALATETVWVGVTTDQPVWFGAELQPIEIKPADCGCMAPQSTLYDWNTGAIQQANEVVWYRIPVDTVRNTTALPYLKVTNRSDMPLTITAELSLECPDSIPNQTRTISLAASGVYQKHISRDMMANLDPSISFVYVRLTSNREFSFRMEMETPELGEACQSAYAFNWLSGNDQEAGTEVWYAIDLSEVKNKAGFDLSLLLKNRSSETGHLEVALAPTCPCPAPQMQTVSVGAGNIITKVIPRSALEMFGNTVWVRINSNVDIHFEAASVPAEPFTPITACTSAINVVYGNNYSQTDTTWYVVDLTALRGTELSPKLVLTNGETAQRIRAEISYVCPVTETMMSYSVQLGADAEVEKMLEHSLVDSVVSKHDKAYIRLSGQSAFSFRVEMVDPNTGSDCAHAQLLQPDVPVVQAAGTTTWYRVPLTALKQPNKEAIAAVRNLESLKGIVAASFYRTCDDEQPLKVAEIRVGAGESFERTLNSNTVMAMRGDELLVELYTERESEVYFTVQDATPIAPVWACEDAETLAPNITYNLVKDAMQWYLVDLRSLRTNYKGDGSFEFVNSSLTDTAKLSAWMAWECPVTTELDQRNFRVLPGESLTQMLTRASLEDVLKDTVYLCLQSTAALQFKASFEAIRGASCAEPLPFEWYARNPYSANTMMWYEVTIDSAAIGNHELCLHAENLGGESVTTSTSIYADCPVTIPFVLDTTVAAGETSNRIILRDSLKSKNWWPNQTLYVMFWAREDMFLSIDTVPCHRVDSAATICQGDSIEVWGRWYKTPGIHRDTIVGIYGSQQIRTLDLTVLENEVYEHSYKTCYGDSVEINGVYYKESTAWVDTMEAKNGCYAYHYYTVTILPSYERMAPERKRICEGEYVKWHGQYYSQPGIYRETLLSSYGCDSVVSLILTMGYASYDTISRTICNGDTLRENGLEMYETGYYNAKYKSQSGCDSVITYAIKVQMTLVDTVKHLYSSDSIPAIDGKWHYRETFDLTEYNPLDMVCEGSSRVHQYIYRAPDLYSDTLKYGCPGQILSHTHPDGTVTLVTRDTLITDTLSGSIKEGGLVVYTTGYVYNTSYRVYEKKEITMREGQLLSWKEYHLDQIKAPNPNEIFTLDTCYTFYTKNFGCDSTVCTRIHVLPRTRYDLYDTICDGKPYTMRYLYAQRWYTKSYTKEGIYTITMDNHLGGDSVVTLFLTVNPSYDETVSYTLVRGDSLIFPNPLTGRDTVLYATNPGPNPTKFAGYTEFGCDSMVTVMIYAIDPMGIEDVWNEGDEHVTQKYLYQGRLYMLIDDRRYDAMGRRIK